jgi:hypothetical protein
LQFLRRRGYGGGIWCRDLFLGGCGILKAVEYEGGGCVAAGDILADIVLMDGIFGDAEWDGVRRLYVVELYDGVRNWTILD